MDTRSGLSAVALILAAIIGGGAYIQGKEIETKHMSQFTITVVGEAKVTAEPDIATLNFGVQTGRQPTADGAMRMLNEKMASIIQGIEAIGIADRDISTQYLSLNPAYDWDEGRRVDQGFEANQSLMVKVRDLSKISQALDVAITAGANQAGNVQFTIDDPEDLRAAAREEAIKDAQMKAKTLADSLGVELEEMTGFWEEQSYGGPQPAMRMEAMDAGYGGGGLTASVPAGEQDVTVRVNLTYRIDED